MHANDAMNYDESLGYKLMDALELCARTCSKCSAFNPVSTHLQCGCGQERYCNRECQRAHWKDEHRETCPARTRTNRMP